MPDTMIERVARAVREEITRQYRDDERGKCPAGSYFYEEHIAPRIYSPRRPNRHARAD